MDKFSLEEYIDENKPTGCQNMTGTYLKNVNEAKNEKCEDILVDKYIPFGKKVVSNETDVCVFVNITAENLNSKSIHHFVIKDGLEVEFNFYDDSQKMSEAMKDLS